MTTKPCECPIAGWCERHGTLKHGRLYELCQTREDYRALWDSQAEREGGICADWQEVSAAVFRCQKCGRTAGAESAAALPKRRRCIKPPPRDVANHPAIPKGGPGTELANIFKDLGIQPKKSCRCGARQARMNAWGPDGCEQNFDTIVGWMREAYEETTVLERFKAVKAAATSGLAFRLNLLDPIPSLVREAIRRAREKTLCETPGSDMIEGKPPPGSPALSAETMP